MPPCNTASTSLGSHLRGWAAHDRERSAIAATIAAIADAAIELVHLIRRSVLEGAGDEIVGRNSDGDGQRGIDVAAHRLMMRHLSGAPVAAVASEETDDITILDPHQPLLVAVDPLDGSANLAVDAPVGLIFSLRRSPVGDAPLHDGFLTAGSHQVGAGLVLFGPAVVLALTVGDGTDLFALDEDHQRFHLLQRGVRTPNGTREYAINTSNSRHWSTAVRSYIDDLTDGADGPRGADFNMRWFGALVADAYRILTRGGIFLYPDDGRPAYGNGRLRLVYEAQPIAMLLEQAGGAATDGDGRILDRSAAHLHARTPLVFGSADKVARVAHYRGTQRVDAERAPLFGRRGLFRDAR